MKDPSATPLVDPRIKARIAIFYGPEQKKLMRDYAVNISTGGVFIETANVLPVDTLLTVKFKLPYSDNIITCRSRVAWINEPATLRALSLPPGMGLQFIDLSLDDLHDVRAFIREGKLNPTW